MNKHLKIFIGFALVISAVLVAKLYYERIETEKIKKISIEYEAKSITNLLLAFRKTYQDIFIKNYTTLDEKNIDFLPVTTTNKISRMFSEYNLDSIIKTVSDNPRNQINQADKRQLDVIAEFKKDTNLKYQFKKIDDKYYYSQPLYIKQSCLKCHGKKENAPEIIQKKYTKAYDYKFGELRGIIDIELKQTKLSMVIEEDYQYKQISVGGFLIIILLIFFAYSRYNYLLEKQLKEELEKNQKKDKQIFHQNKMAQMGEMLSMIAHQWRQPLSAINATSISINLKARFDDLNNKDVIAKTDKISDYSQNLSNTINDFRNLFISNKKREWTDFTELVKNILSIIEVSIINQNIELILDLNCKKRFEIYPNEMKQVILNLIQNAQEVLLSRRVENPFIKISTYEKGEKYILEISDNGGGVKKEIIEDIFHPYFSTKSKKNGMGLGLYMCNAIIEEHCKGKLTLSNSKDGAVFRVILG